MHDVEPDKYSAPSAACHAPVKLQRSCKNEAIPRAQDISLWLQAGQHRMLTVLGDMCSLWAYSSTQSKQQCQFESLTATVCRQTEVIGAHSLTYPKPLKHAKLKEGAGSGSADPGQHQEDQGLQLTRHAGFRLPMA